MENKLTRPDFILFSSTAGVIIASGFVRSPFLLLAVSIGAGVMGELAGRYYLAKWHDRLKFLLERARSK